MPARGGAREGREAGDGHGLAPRHAEAERGHHRDARDVLRRHRHDVERHGEPDGRLPRQRRDGEVEAGDGVGPGEGAAPHGLVPDDRERDRERRRRGPARRDPQQHEPREHDGRDEQRRRDERADGREAQREQHPREHRLGDRGGDRGDEVAEARPERGEQHEPADDAERADRGGPAPRDRARADEQRGPGRGPGERERGAVARRQPEDADGLRHAQGEEPGRGLVGRRADGAQAGEHDGERAREADEGRDEPGEDGAQALRVGFHAAPADVPSRSVCGTLPEWPESRPVGCRA